MALTVTFSRNTSQPKRVGVTTGLIKTEKPLTLAWRARFGSTWVTRIEKENTMTVSLTLEASQPCGKTYRLGLGCNLHLASMIALLLRLF